MQDQPSEIFKITSDDYRHKFEGTYTGINTFINTGIVTDDDKVWDSTSVKSVVVAIVPRTKDEIMVDAKKIYINRTGIYNDPLQEPHFYYSLKFVGDSLYITSGCSGIGYCFHPCGDVFKGKK